MSSLFVAGGFAASHSAHASSLTPVKVQVNDDLVKFPDAQPFLDSSSRTQVPIRMVSEKMGYNVDYSMEGQQVKVTISNKDKKVVLKTGDNEALVNGKPVQFDTNAQFVGGRTYVPVRFISESLNTMVQWDNSNYIAIVAADGQYHAPAWYKPAPLPQAKPAAVTVAENAPKYTGVPYVWGGSTPFGFDCSGFIKYLYAQQGITLPRTANEMYQSTGWPVSELQYGDLVFFSDSKAAPATHVGIYVGNGKFISATSSNGIQTENLFTGYWGARYFAAKRV